LSETLQNFCRIHIQAIHPLKMMDKRHFFGKGKLCELASHIQQSKGVTAAVVGIDMLNSAQLATLQDSWGVPVYDRYVL
jgi:50S ribosomal subunit-associated GTPase HflX